MYHESLQSHSSNIPDYHIPWLLVQKDGIESASRELSGTALGSQNLPEVAMMEVLQSV